MDHGLPRFQCLPESSGKWLVWDNETGQRASLGGCVIAGRSEMRAKTACEILTKIYRNRLDAQSIRERASR